MSLGFVILIHESFLRSEQLVRHLSERGCPIVVHVDAAAGRSQINTLKTALADLENVKFIPSRRCEWGTWSLVEATLEAAACLLKEVPDVEHIYLASGSCLPLRPVAELKDYLHQRRDTDFIESVTIEDVDWTIDGLSKERFSLWFPFGWKRHRRLFELSVWLQRKMRIGRRMPRGIEPHLGSQWWCLTRATLHKIINDPRRRQFDRYFRRTWIPDESYFQTLARHHTQKISSRSLTLSKFDHLGKPHVFHDDHLPLLRRSDCFVVRKVWHNSDRLYRSFLSDLTLPANAAEPSPSKIERVFAAATHRQRHGRAGLYMAGRHPFNWTHTSPTAAPYWVFHGLSDVFSGFDDWFSQASGARIHGHLFAPRSVEFAGGESVFSGGLSSKPALRDYRPEEFLRNLVWNTRGEPQAFRFGPQDRQEISGALADDPNACVFVITGAWAIPLFRQQLAGEDIRKNAARFQRIEAEHLERLRNRWCRARVRIWSLTDAVQDPTDIFQDVAESVSHAEAANAVSLPEVVPLTGFAGFVQGLRDAGMNPYLVGDFTKELESPDNLGDSMRPYLIN